MNDPAISNELVEVIKANPQLQYIGCGWGYGSGSGIERGIGYGNGKCVETDFGAGYGTGIAHSGGKKNCTGF